MKTNKYHDYLTHRYNNLFAVSVGSLLQAKTGRKEKMKKWKNELDKASWNLNKNLACGTNWNRKKMIVVRYIVIAL